jgi:hypothetical protein
MTSRRVSRRSNTDEKISMLQHYDEKLSQVKEMLYLASYNELKYDEQINLYNYLRRVIDHKLRLEKELGYGKRADENFSTEKQWIESGLKRLRSTRKKS